MRLQNHCHWFRKPLPINIRARRVHIEPLFFCIANHHTFAMKHCFGISVTLFQAKAFNWKHTTESISHIVRTIEDKWIESAHRHWTLEMPWLFNKIINRQCCRITMHLAFINELAFPHDVATLSHWLLSILTKWKDSRNHYCLMFKLKWPQMNCRIFICVRNSVFQIILTVELIKNIDSIVLQFQQNANTLFRVKVCSC